MTAGTLVTYLAHPDWGTGIIEFVSPTNRIIASFETPDGPYTDEFGAFELEQAHPSKAAV